MGRCRAVKVFSSMCAFACYVAAYFSISRARTVSCLEAISVIPWAHTLSIARVCIGSYRMLRLPRVNLRVMYNGDIVRLASPIQLMQKGFRVARPHRAVKEFLPNARSMTKLRSTDGY